MLDDLKNVKPDTRTNAQRVIANGAARVGMTPEAYVAASKRFGVPSVEMGYDGRQATKRFIEEMKEPSYLFTGGGRAVGAALTGANEADTPSFMSALLNVNAPGADRELAKMNGAQAQLAKFAMNAVEPENIALTIAGGALGKASPLLGQILSGIFAGQMGAQAFKQAEEGDLNGALVTAGSGGWQGLHAAGVEMPTLFNQDGSVPGERQNAAPDPKGRPAKTTAKQRRQQVQLDEYNKIQDDIARVRHYTSKDGVTGIKRSQSITPARKKDGVIGVHVARQPFGPMQGAAEEMGIAVPRGKPFGYVEFNAPDSLQETYGVGPRSTGVIPSEDGPLDISGLDPKYVQMALLQRLLQRNGWHYFAP